MMGQYRRALEYGKRNAALLHVDRYPRDRESQLHGAGAAGYAPSALTWLVLSNAEVGEFAEAIAWGDEVTKLVEAGNDPSDLVWGYFGVGRLNLVKGDLQKAIGVLERALPLCEVGELPVYFPRVATTLGAAYTLSGRVAEGLDLLSEAVKRGEALRFKYSHPLVVAQLGEGYLRAGRQEEAAQAAHQALELARRQGERGHEAYTLRLLGEIVARGPSREVEQAGAYYGQALAIAHELEMRPLEGRCHLALSALHHQLGRGVPARAALATATDLFRAMEMKFWLERAEAEAAKIGAGTVS